MRLQPLLVPGWKNSSPDHWQTHWQQQLPRARRVQQQSWTKPERDPWVQALNKAIEASSHPVLLIAHSLGCITVAHLSAALRHKVVAAMLVAPADIERPGAPAVFASFAPIPLQTLHFPSVVVASANDPSCTLERAAFFAQAWGSRFEAVGELGHINAESKLGNWPQGLKILNALRRRACLLECANHPAPGRTPSQFGAVALGVRIRRGLSDREQRPQLASGTVPRSTAERRLPPSRRLIARW